MHLSPNIRLAVLALILVCTVGWDQGAKRMARRELLGREVVVLPGGWGEFRLAENPGSFLSLGDSLPEAVRISVFTIGTGLGLTGLLCYLALTARLGWLPFLGLSLVCAGGVSNLIDRITRHGRVCDFMLIRLGPFHTGVFNVADMIIMLGIALLAWEFWRQRQPQPA